MKTLEEKNLALKKRIMRRVYFVWTIRALLHPVFLKTLIVLVFFVRSTDYISYANVFANAPTFADLPGALVFMQSAFANTELSSLFLLSGMGVVGVWLASDLRRKQNQNAF